MFKKNHRILYCEFISRNFYHVKFTIKLGLCVTKLIFIPENQATTFYTSKVLADSGVCDVCGSECFCSAKV